MNIQSKETKKLQQAFLESHLKDLRKLEGKCFLSMDAYDDDDDEDGSAMEATFIQKVTDKGSFIVTIASVVNASDETSFAEIAVDEELDALQGDPCSRTEFDNIVERAKAMIEKKLSEIKVEKKG